jgi:hypothetical protein
MRETIVIAQMIAPVVLLAVAIILVVVVLRGLRRIYIELAAVRKALNDRDSVDPS